MFSLAWSEILLVLVLAIFLIGPKELPSVLKFFGRLSRQISAYVRGVKAEFNHIVEEEELKEFKKSLNLYDPGQEALGEYAKYYEWDETGKMKIPDDRADYKPLPKEETSKEVVND